MGGKKCQYNLTTIMMGKSGCVDNYNKHMIRNREQVLRCILSCYENSKNGHGLFWTGCVCNILEDRDVINEVMLIWERIIFYYET